MSYICVAKNVRMSKNSVANVTFIAKAKHVVCRARGWTTEIVVEYHAVYKKYTASVRYRPGKDASSEGKNHFAFGAKSHKRADVAFAMAARDTWY